MEKSRRSFLKIAGVAALGVGFTKPTLNAYASSVVGPHPQIGDKALSAHHWGMVIDTRKFHSEKDLEPIVEACHKAHNVPDFSDMPNATSAEKKRHEIKWIWGEPYHNAFTDKENHYQSHRIEHLSFPVLCNHCEEPPCVLACPTKATFRRDDGIVLMDFHRCIGCRFCMAACPYGSRSFNFVDPRRAENLKEETCPDFPTRMKGVVEKCNLCAERLAKGLQPACAEASKGAIAVGDLGDPHSNVRVLLEHNFSIRRKPSLGTEPSVYYIV